MGYQKSDYKLLFIPYRCINPTIQNELIKPGQHKKIPCFYMVPAEIIDFQPEIEMYMCTQDEAPSHKAPSCE
jgi:hypothetical protein